MYDKKYMTYELEIAQLQEEFKNKNYGCHVGVYIGNDDTALYVLGDSSEDTPLLPIRLIYNPLQEDLTKTMMPTNCYIGVQLNNVRELAEYVLKHPEIYFKYPEEYPSRKFRF